MAEIGLDGVRTFYEEHGSGPSLVLVHGLGGTGTDIFKRVLADLARDFRVVAYDLRGSGRSAVPPGPYTIELLADDLHALLGALDLAPAAFVGHSLGGSIVLREAAAHPEAVRAVVGLGAPTRLPDQAREGLEARAQAVLADGMAAVAETVATNGLAPTFREAHAAEYQELVSLLASAPVEGYAAQCRALVAMDLTADLGRIRAPTLLLSGDRDGVAPPAAAREHAAAIAGARFVEVADCGHILPWERPDELLAAVRPFLLERG